MLLQHFQRLGGQQRGAAHLEEVVVCLQPVDGQHRLEQRHHLLLQGAQGRVVDRSYAGSRFCVFCYTRLYLFVGKCKSGFGGGYVTTCNARVFCKGFGAICSRCLRNTRQFGGEAGAFLPGGGGLNGGHRGRLGRFGRHGGRGCVFHGLQCPAIQLAVQRDRQLRHMHEAGRHHVDGQAGAAVIAQRIVIGQRLARCRHQPGHQTALAIGGRLVRDGGAGHGRMSGQHGLDLARFDPETADLELPVQPAQIFEPAIVQPAHGIAGAVEHVVRLTERVVHEALAGQVRAVQVAQGEAWAADVEFAGQPRRHRFAGGGEHPHVGPVDRTAQRYRTVRGQIVFRHRAGHGEGGGLRGAIAVDQLQPGQRLQCLAHVAWRQGLAARHQRAQPLQMQRVLVHDAVEECRRQPGRIDALVADGGGQPRARGDGLRVDHASAAIEQRPPDFEGRGIEGERGRMQHHQPRIERCVILAVHQPDDGAVRNDHALGRSGRTGGVHHIGPVPRRVAHAHQRLFRELLGQLWHGVLGDQRFVAALLAWVGIDVPDRNVPLHGHFLLPGQGVGIGQQQGGLAVLEHQRQPLRRTGRVDGHIHGAQPQDGQHQRNALGATRQQHRHPVAGAHVHRLQTGGVAHRDVVQRLVRPAHAVLAGHAHGQRLRMALALQLEAVDDGGLWQA